MVVICDYCFQGDYEEITPPLLEDNCYICGTMTRDHYIDRRSADKILFDEGMKMLPKGLWLR